MDCKMFGSKSATTGQHSFMDDCQRANIVAGMQVSSGARKIWLLTKLMWMKRAPPPSLDSFFA